jgi:hypothetical protein
VFQLFSHAPNIEVAPMHGETVLFNPQSNKFCLLNPTAAKVWSILEAPSSPDAIVNERAYSGADSASVAKDVAKVLEEMAHLQFVVAE